MPINKNAFLRYRIIDGCLTRKFLRDEVRDNTMPQIIDTIEKQLDISISDSMFHKDIQNMKRIFSAPIKFDRIRNRYCYTEPDFSIKEFPLTHEEIEALDEKYKVQSVS